MNDNNIKIGIDRLKFSVSVVYINTDVYRGHIENGERSKVIDITNDKVINISSFKCDVKGISIVGTDDYRIQLKLNDKNDKFTLDVNVPKLLYNGNERNANNLQHLSEVNKVIEKKLSEQGIYIDMASAKISSLEININSPDAKLYDAMKIIRKGWNTTDETVFIAEKGNKQNSIMIKNRYVKIKVYNKTQQLKDTGQLWENENLVRIEITALDPSAIDTITNYNPTMDGIIENWDKLEKWFKDTLNKHIKKPCDDFNKSVENSMVEKLKQGHKTYDILTLQAVEGNLVDMEIFSRAIKRYYKETGRKSPHTSIKNTKNRFEKYDNELYESLVGNVLALEKLWDAIGI